MRALLRATFCGLLACSFPVLASEACSGSSATIPAASKANADPAPVDTGNSATNGAHDEDDLGREPRADAGAETDASGGDPADASASACQDLDLSKEVAIGSTVVKGPPPAMTGGTLAPGLYHLAAATYYVTAGNPDPPPAKQLGRLALSANELAYAVEPRSTAARTVTTTYTTTGNTLVATPRCYVLEDAGTLNVIAPPTTVTFTATPNKLIVPLRELKRGVPQPDGGLLVTDEAVGYLTFTR